MEPFFILSSLLSFLIPVLIIGAIVYLVVRRRDGKSGITTYQVLMAYFYAVTLASVITIAIGAAYLVFVVLSQAYDGGEIADELALGLTLLSVGAIICVLHVYGRRAVERKAKDAATTIGRVYLFFMLAIFSISGLVALPLAVNGTIRYYIEESNRGDPSAQVAAAVVVVPLWIYYLLRVLRETRAERREAS